MYQNMVKPLSRRQHQPAQGTADVDSSIERAGLRSKGGRRLASNVIANQDSSDGTQVQPQLTAPTQETIPTQEDEAEQQSVIY